MNYHSCLEAGDLKHWSCSKSSYIKFVLHWTGASSSILEDRNKVLEKILDDLHRGNFRPVIRSEVHTPDMIELDPFEFSNISFVESPCLIRQHTGTYVSEEDILSPTELGIKPKVSSGKGDNLLLCHNLSCLLYEIVKVYDYIFNTEWFILSGI